MIVAMRAGSSVLVAGALAVALSFSAVACDLKTTDSDAGVVDAGKATGTVGGQCTQIETAYCQKAIACLARSETLAQCVADTMLTCCSGSKCDQAAQTSDTKIGTCVDAISQEDCNAITQGGTPVPCVGIPKQ